MKREQEKRQLQEEHDKKTQKMAALLEAAATGRLWSERGGNTSMGLELQDIEDDKTEQSSSTARKVVSVLCVLCVCFLFCFQLEFTSHSFETIPERQRPVNACSW